ncbi:unnamed protein product [Arctogadus glacialis]
MPLFQVFDICGPPPSSTCSPSKPCVTGARAIGGTSPPFRQVSSTHPIAALNLETPERRKASLCRQMALLLQSVSAAESSDGAVMQGKLVFHHSEVLLPGRSHTAPRHSDDIDPRRLSSL